MHPHAKTILLTPSQETFVKLRHSGENRPFTGRNVHPEGLGKRGSDYQCVGLKRWPGVLQRSLSKGETLAPARQDHHVSPFLETFAKLRRSGENRPFTGRNVHPEGLGKRGSNYQCVGLKRWPGVLQKSLSSENLAPRSRKRGSYGKVPFTTIGNPATINNTRSQTAATR